MPNSVDDFARLTAIKALNGGGSYTLPTASSATKGGIKVNGTNTTVVSEVLTIADATDILSGLESAEDKTKLDGIEAEANKYILPTSSTVTLGGVKVDGTTITIDANGAISSSGSGYQPDNLTIGLTAESKLEVVESIINTINGVGTDVSVADVTIISQVMQPNVHYEIDADTTCTTLTLSLATATSGVYSIYSASIKCGATPPTFTEISGVIWSGTFALTANKVTEISILNLRGIFYAL